MNSGKTIPHTFSYGNGKNVHLKTKVKFKKGREGTKLCLLWGEIWIPVPDKNAIYIYSLSGKRLRKVLIQEPDVMPYSCVACSNVTFAIVGKQGGLIIERKLGKVLEKLDCGGSDVCFYDDKLYFLESNRIVVYHHDGTEWTRHSIIEIPHENKISLGSLIISENHIFIASFTGNCILKCGHDGNIRKVYRQKELEDDDHEDERGEISYPVLCGVDSSGTLMFCNNTSTYIQLLHGNSSWGTLCFGDAYPLSALHTAPNKYWLLCEEDRTVLRLYEIT